jgi:hypothetical protein
MRFFSTKPATRSSESRAAEAQHGTEDKAEKSSDGDRSADTVEHRNARKGENSEADHGAEIGEHE